MSNSKFFDGREIETEFGYVPFSGIRKIENRETIKVTLEDGSSIQCTPDHKFVVNGESIVANSLCPQDYLETISGKMKIKYIEETDPAQVFDIIGVDNPNSSFYANTINNHNCSFTGSSYTLIDGDILSNIKSIDPAYYTEEGYYMWKRPEPNRLYVIGVDVAKGANTDYHVCNIFDVTNHHKGGKIEQVAMFRRNDISVFEFKDKIIEFAKQWNEAVVIIENNHLGHTVVQNVYFEDGYENTFYDYDKGEYGINANVKTKPVALSYFKEDVESGKMIINSSDMITELGYYEEVRTGVFQARTGRNFHDDTVAAGYWVSYLLRSRYWEDYFLWWMQNNDPKAQEFLSHMDNDTEQIDQQTADGFLNALGGNNADDDMDQFMRELSQ